MTTEFQQARQAPNRIYRTPTLRGLIQGALLLSLPVFLLSAAPAAPAPAVLPGTELLAPGTGGHEINLGETFSFLHRHLDRSRTP